MFSLLREKKKHCWECYNISQLEENSENVMEWEKK